MFTTLALDFLRKHVVTILQFLAVAVIVWAAYSWAYNRGEQAAQVVCEARFAAQQKFRDEQISTIEGYAKSNLILTAESMEALIKKINSIKPTGPLTNVPCTPTPAFISTANSIIDKANGK